jgi:hypothetical protein
VPQQGTQLLALGVRHGPGLRADRVGKGGEGAGRNRTRQHRIIIRICFDDRPNWCRDDQSCERRIPEDQDGRCDVRTRQALGKLRALEHLGEFGEERSTGRERNRSRTRGVQYLA